MSLKDVLMGAVGKGKAIIAEATATVKAQHGNNAAVFFTTMLELAANAQMLRMALGSVPQRNALAINGLYESSTLACLDAIAEVSNFDDEFCEMLQQRVIDTLNQLQEVQTGSLSSLMDELAGMCKDKKPANGASEG